MKILIAEDNELWRKFFIANLKNYTEITIAKDGAEAIQILDKENFDLLITDCKMPNVSGPELIKFCESKNKKFPIFGMTACYDNFAKFDSPLIEKTFLKNNTLFAALTKAIDGITPAICRCNDIGCLKCDSAFVEGEQAEREEIEEI